MSLNLYPPTAFDVYNKIKLTYSSSIDAACDEIKKACKGLGTDEKALIKVLGMRSANDRALIAYRFKELYKEELKDQLSSEVGGDLGFLFQLIAVPLPQAEAFILNKAMAGAGTSEHLIYPIVMGRSNEEMNVLKRAFFELYGKDLAVALNNELGGDFKKIIMSAIQSPIVAFNASFHTKAKAEEDADKLYKAGEGKWGTDEEGFLKVLMASPPKHIAQIDAAYKSKHKTGLKEAVIGEFTGDAESALLFHVRAAVEPKSAIADLVESSMKGLGTDETALCATIVRYHPYLNAIAEVYQAKNKMSIKDRVKGEVSGELKELLAKVIDAPITAPAIA